MRKGQTLKIVFGLAGFPAALPIKWMRSGELFSSEKAEIGYGYGLVKQLSYYGFTENELNVSTLYRTLRKMENERLVTSMWEEGGPGPKRRMYEITEAGKNESSRCWV